MAVTVERLTCPRQPSEVGLDMPGFRDAVAHDRCPLSGCELVPFERQASHAASGARPETTGRCDPAEGGCGAEWVLHGAAEVAWYGREVVVEFDWPDEEEPTEGVANG